MELCEKLRYKKINKWNSIQKTKLIEKYNSLVDELEKKNKIIEDTLKNHSRLEDEVKILKKGKLLF